MVTLNDIRNALRRIRPSIGVSPAAQSQELSRIAGGPVFLKLELQRTGSFKERGALHRLLTLTAEEQDRGLVTASAGNRAQAVAYHAGRIGVQSQIWMPITTPLAKVSATRKHGAEVVLHGTSFDEVYTAARESCCRERRTFVHRFDDEHLIAGQGTIGPEILEQLPQLDAAIVPVGRRRSHLGPGGRSKGIWPRIHVIGVQTSSLPSMSAALQEKVPVLLPAASTIADGIAVRSAGEKTLPLVQKYVDDLVRVEEEEIANSILFLLERERNVAEGAERPELPRWFTPRLISTVKRRLSWCRAAMWMSRSWLARIIERGLVKDGRLVRLRIHLPDHPGALNRLTGVIATKLVNIGETSYERAHYGVGLGDTAIDLAIETRVPDHDGELA